MISNNKFESVIIKSGLVSIRISYTNIDDEFAILQGVELLMENSVDYPIEDCDDAKTLVNELEKATALEVKQVNFNGTMLDIENLNVKYLIENNI